MRNSYQDTPGAVAIEHVTWLRRTTRHGHRSPLEVRRSLLRATGHTPPIGCTWDDVTFAVLWEWEIIFSRRRAKELSPAAR